MRAKYITIEREYGSGGRIIATRIAEECCIPCFGREILEKAVKYLKITTEEAERYEESSANSLMYSLAMIGKYQTGCEDMLTSEGHLYVAEQLAIRDLALNGPAIFIGHCVAAALEDCKGVMKVFIHSSMEERKNRIVEEYGIPASDVAGTIRRFDKKRAGYYMMNTVKKWDDYRNYDIVLDSSSLGIDGCVAVLKPLLVNE